MYGTQFCEMGRKLLLTGVLIVFLNDRSTAYALCAFCVSFSALLLHTLVQPYVYAKKKIVRGLGRFGAAVYTRRSSSELSRRELDNGAVARARCMSARLHTCLPTCSGSDRSTAYAFCAFFVSLLCAPAAHFVLAIRHAHAHAHAYAYMHVSRHMSVARRSPACAQPYTHVRPHVHTDCPWTQSCTCATCLWFLRHGFCRTE